MEKLLLLSSLLVFMGFLLIPVSRKLGAPILLIVLIAGMLMGEDGPGKVIFSDFQDAHTLGTLALAIILFAGGLETDVRRLRGARLPAVILATAGVILTAAIVGVPASFILNIPLEHGLLLGAVVGSTDAAATFLLIQQSRIGLKPRLQNTLVLESGLNDPTAIFLTLALTVLVNSGEGFSISAFDDFIPLLFMQLGLGLVAGFAGGFILSWLLDRLRLGPGLYPPMALAGALALFAGTSMAGGSGFLAVYVCGLVMAGRLVRPLERILHFHEGMQWLSQIGLFLMLGLLVRPSALPAILPSALAVAAFLILVARPIAVYICTFFLGFRPKEMIFLGWVGLRGAVPIYLAILPVITDGPITVDFFNVVFVIVVTSLIFQGWTITSSAHWLGLVNQPDDSDEPQPLQTESQEDLERKSLENERA